MQLQVEYKEGTIPCQEIISDRPENKLLFAWIVGAADIS